MKSVNYKLREAYITALNGLTVNSIAIPIYYLELPQDETPNNYIILSDIGSNENGTMYKHCLDTAMQLSIHTVEQYGNSGKMADDIADAVFQILLPETTSKLNLGNDFQMVGLKLTGDRTNNLTTEGNDYFVTRILSFEQKIFIR